MEQGAFIGRRGAALGLLLVAALLVSGAAARKDAEEKDDNGCVKAAGQVWCKSLRKCIVPTKTTVCPPEATPRPTSSKANATRGPSGTKVPDSPRKNETHTSLSDCPSNPKTVLAGGWAPITTPSSEETVAALNYMLGFVNAANETYTVKAACSQVVAGLNYYFKLGLGDGATLKAKFFRGLDGKYAMSSLGFEASGSR